MFDKKLFLKIMSLYNCNTTQFANEFMNIEIYLHVPLLTDLIQITWSNLLGFFNSIYILRFYVIFFLLILMYHPSANVSG